MPVLLRLSMLATLLFGGQALAVAESPMPDPIAPAVIGRPLDPSKPSRGARESTAEGQAWWRWHVAPPSTPTRRAASKQEPSRQAASKPAAARQAAARPGSQKLASPKHASSGTASSKPAPSRPGAPALAAATAGIVAPPASPQARMGAPADVAATARPAKQALDDRADPRMRLADVGQGTHFARKPLGPGAYFGQKHRLAARRYFEEHPASAKRARWQIGEPVPRGAPLEAVPPGLMATLPQVPPGHVYVQLGGDVVLVAQASRMVVDGISRSER